MTITAKPRTFHGLVDTYFDDYFKVNPSQATSVGFHQYDHQLEDLSLAAHPRNRSKFLEYLAAFQPVNPPTLSPNEHDVRALFIATIPRLLPEQHPAHPSRKKP